MVGNGWDPHFLLVPISYFQGHCLLLVWGVNIQDVGAEGPFVACDGTLAVGRWVGSVVFFFWGGGDFHRKKPRQLAGGLNHFV